MSQSYSNRMQKKRYVWGFYFFRNPSKKKPIIYRFWSILFKIIILLQEKKKICF